MTGWVAGPVADEAVWQHIEEASAVGGVRHRAVAMAERLGFEEFRAGQVALAVSEAASNLHKHATQGV
ncbi:MAG: transcriptional regulator, partial [Streptosporangiaceae bacterium]